MEGVEWGSIMNWKDRVNELTVAHWDYHKALIPCLAPFMTDEEICAFGEWYREIGKHFYNHALEDVREGRVEI